MTEHTQVPAEISPLSQFNEHFSKPLIVSTATYAVQVLLYMQRRPELEMAGIGAKTIPYFQAIRNVEDKYLRTYYQFLTGIVRPLLRYASLEESCSMSGAYNPDRLKTLDSVHQAIHKFENPEDPKVFEYLNGMINTP